MDFRKATNLFADKNLMVIPFKYMSQEKEGL